MVKDLENIVKKSLKRLKNLETLKDPTSDSETKIVTDAVYETREVYAPIVKSLDVANQHNSKLTQDIVSLEAEVIRLNKELVDFRLELKKALTGNLNR